MSLFIHFYSPLTGAVSNAPLKEIVIYVPHFNFESILIYNRSHKYLHLP